MIGPLAALLIAAATSPPEGVAYGPRIAASAAAAQALQGPLDGTWTLYDSHGCPLYVFQISDPAGGAGPLAGAWRALGPRAALGVVTGIERRGERLTIDFTPADEVGAVRLRLMRRGAGAWRGWMMRDGRGRRVRLARGG